MKLWNKERSQYVDVHITRAMLSLHFRRSYGPDEARYVITRRYVTFCYILYRKWRRYVTNIFLLHSVAIRDTLCNNIVTYRSANGNYM
jgi:hypothetical protein